MNQVAVESYLQKVISAKFLNAVRNYGLQKVSNSQGNELWEGGNEREGLDERIRFGVQTLVLTFAKPITNFASFAAALKAVPGGEYVIEHPRRPGQPPGITPAEIQKADAGQAAATAASKAAAARQLKPVAAPKPAPAKPPQKVSNVSEILPPGIFIDRNGVLENGTIQKTADGKFWAILRIINPKTKTSTEKRLVDTSEEDLLELIRHEHKVATIKIRPGIKKLSWSPAAQQQAKLFDKGVVGSIFFDPMTANFWGVWKNPEDSKLYMEAAPTENQLIEDMKRILEMA